MRYIDFIWMVNKKLKQQVKKFSNALALQKDNKPLTTNQYHQLKV